MRTLLFVVSAVVLSGCLPPAPALSPEALAVRTTRNPNVVTGCKFVGDVAGSDISLTGHGWARSEGKATSLVKFRADSLGGNLVYVNAVDTDAGGSTVKGEAYHCDSVASR